MLSAEQEQRTVPDHVCYILFVVLLEKNEWSFEVSSDEPSQMPSPCG